jgi:divalent metal cation (Fe/Co/Zn/Cd) transporter
VGAWGQITDAGVSTKTQQALIRALDPLLESSSASAEEAHLEKHDPNLLAIRHLRARRAGSLMFVDLTADVRGTLCVSGTSELEGKITQALKTARREVAEVRVKFHAVESQ